MAEVRLEEITKFYGSLKIIDKLNLGIGSGEFVTLLGPSGSGKTTTLKIVAGLELPTSGKLSIGGQDMTRVPVNMRKIGMVFQNLALFPHMTVAENVAFGLRMRRLPRARIEEDVARALDMVQLSRFSGRTPDQISGGQQQRVALARAFVFNPSVLLLDEPLSALDRKLREEMQIEIRQLVQKLGLTAIFVTHDQEEALTLSDRIAVMNNGLIEQCDTPAKLFREPATEFVATFMGVSNMLGGRATAGTPGVVEVAAGNGLLRFAVSRPLSTGRQVRLGLRPEDAIVETGPVAPDNDRIACRVETAIFQGSVVALGLRPMAAPDVVLHARVTLGATTEHMAELKAGDMVGVGWRANSVLVYE